MNVTLASNITTTTNGPYAAIQPIGKTDPVVVEIVGKVVGTSATIQVQESADASSFSTVSTLTYTTAGLISVQHVARKPFIRLNVSAISSAAVDAEANIC